MDVSKKKQGSGGHRRSNGLGVLKERRQRLQLDTTPREGGIRTSVIVPSYRRPESLHVCLRVLEAQTTHPDQVIVVIREDDLDSRELLSRPMYRLPVNVIVVSKGGQVAALNTGLQAVRGDIVVFTDDDAAPWPTWLSKITDLLLADSTIGGVGGADHVSGVEYKKRPVRVGRLQWFGRCTGNHHLGIGAVQQVDILKGVNMAFKRAAIVGLCFDERLRGSGAQVHNDLAFSLAVRSRGWRLLYDPQIIVDHHVAGRFDEDGRGIFDNAAVRNAVHNETLVILDFLSWPRKFVYILWAVTCGTSAAPGLVQSARTLVRERRIDLRMLAASLGGRLEGILSFLSEYSGATRPSGRSES